MIGANDKHASYFTYGRYEGAHGGYIPPAGVTARALYWIGNMIGRLFGWREPRRS